MTHQRISQKQHCVAGVRFEYCHQIVRDYANSVGNSRLMNWRPTIVVRRHVGGVSDEIHWFTGRLGHHQRRRSS